MTDTKTQTTLLGLIRQRSPLMLWSSVALGLVAGAAYSLIIPVLMQGLDGSATGWVREHHVVLFFALCLAIFFAKAGSVILVTIIVKDVTADLRIRLCERINAARVRDVERIGMDRLTNILVEDIGRIGFAAVCLPMVSIELVTIAGMLAYLAWLNWLVFAAVFATIVLCFLLYQLPMRASMRYMDRSRTLRDRVQGGIRGIVFGAYELKLDRAKSRRFIAEEIAAPERESASVDKRADVYLHITNTFSDLFSFLVIGFVAFVVPKLVPGANANLYGVVMALLYIIVPISVMLTLMPNIQRGSVALSRVAELEAVGEEPRTSEPIAPWQQLRVQNLQYQYHDEHGGFGLKPISLDFRRGEVVFVVGGNGSGKSTLAKLLSLHYEPGAGEIFFDRTRIGPHNLAAARESVAVIYSNYYLFERIYAPLDAAREARARELLAALGLAGKTDIVDGRFTTTRLSDGQRRRLALLVALLDDRDVYLFDEWAADQDPEFREVFYTRILGELRAAGKLVIAISHDDRYFAHADRVVVMEYGDVREVRETARARTPAVALA
jgi:putative pyoverdin transport system ATP-binding/permease protein